MWFVSTFGPSGHDRPTEQDNEKPKVIRSKDPESIMTSLKRGWVNECGCACRILFS